jgi:2-polyprenyl-3-methyl-5-hydroxy-6-metoxy-1,4-benzoquinol methylase
MAENYFECPSGRLNSERCNWQRVSGLVRDANETGVRQCQDCELVTHVKDLRNLVNYAGGTMHNWAGGYGELSANPNTDISRRQSAILKLKPKYVIRNILDFGSGNGEMLKSLATEFEVAGLEPEISAREASNMLGYPTHSSIDEIVREKKTFDAVTMFHVIEHLYNPGEILRATASILSDNEILILETPNANDALLRLYKNKNFENFTYWSHHPMLYSHKALESIVSRAGFEVIENEGVQRYSIANHLYWLVNGKPGGHDKWENEFSSETSINYNLDLIKKRQNDTLWLIARKLN